MWADSLKEARPTDHRLSGRCCELHQSTVDASEGAAVVIFPEGRRWSRTRDVWRAHALCIRGARNRRLMNTSTLVQGARRLTLLAIGRSLARLTER